MPNRQNRHLPGINPIDNAVIAPDQFADVLARGFGYLPATFWEPPQLSNASENVMNPFFSGD
jgi:hypothetical protein